MSKYRLVLTGLEMAERGRVALLNLLEAWAMGTGARNVSSGVIRREEDPATDTMVYSAHFDSAHWTGRRFESFDKKHPGETQIN